MARDVFPVTMATWIGVRMRAGDAGRLDVNRHLMSVYYEPLKVYFLGTRCRWLGEPDDIVGGFFASRLGRDGFVDEWERSGMPLRRWLMNALNFYLKEKMRERERNAVAPPPADEAIASDAGPRRAMDRAFVVALVRHALERAQGACEAEGLKDHWTIFYEHFVRDLPYAGVAERLRIDPARCVVMARTARTRFQAALREALAADGAPEGAQADAEILSLLEEPGS